ncbi:MAG: carboxypeptidase-like regulatory domain-containing protein [Terriglobia bacterium]
MKRHNLFWTTTMMFAAAACLLMAARQLRADNVYGSIRGTVTDQSGAVIPGAEITVKNTATGTTRTTLSSSGGSFEVVNLLAPGVYNVSAEKSGFEVYVSANIHLNVNQVFVVNAVLQVGQTTQEITVQANTAQIDTTTIERGTTITGSQIVNLPLNGRNWTSLQQLQPGVEASSDRFGTYSTNGAETQQNSYLINGTDSMDIPLNEPGIIPSPDAIGEFRMITSSINPEYGRNSGAILNAVIKPGTNRLHGDGFEFYRDTSLDSRNFFQKTVAPFHRNQFGGTIGGPIAIPHIYNGRNRTFFFFSYQGNRNVQPESFSEPTVFTPDERSGNFSADTGGAFPAINANTGSPAISPSPMIGISGATYPAGTPYATLFPTGIVPTADLNPLALKLMNQFVPPANAPNSGYTFNPSNAGIDDQYITRIDQNIGTKDSIYGYGFWERNPNHETLPFTGADLPGFAETNLRHYQEYTADWNHIFSPTTINEARFGYFRFNYAAVTPSSPINPTSYGFTGILPQIPSEASIPVMSLTGYFTLGFSKNGPQPRIDQQYNVVDNFTKIAGHHTMKFGFNMDRIEVFNPFLPNLGGNFAYQGSGTFSTGFPAADFLLGIPDSYTQGSGVTSNVRSREYYSYAQDQWQIRPNFTVTYGVGWDIETPYTNLAFGGKLINAFRVGQQSTVFPAAPVGLLWPGDKGISSTGGVPTQYHDFAPRAGFAWSPGSSRNWSVRAGAGLYYNRGEEEGSLQNIGAPPYMLTGFGVGDQGCSPSFAAPYVGWCPGINGGPPTPFSEPNKFPFSPPTGSQVNFSEFEPMSLNVFSPHFGVPRSVNYNLTIERQVTPSMIFDIGYVGNLGRHLEGASSLQYAGDPPGVNPGAVALNCSFSNLGFCDPGSFSLDKQYGPNYAPTVYGDLGQQETDFNSNYNSLQISVNKTFTHGLQFQASYTYARYFDYTSNLESSAFNAPGIDPFNWHNMYGPSDNDAPQRFVFNYYYTLPIYHFIHRLRPLTDGWTLTGITTFQSGFPLGLWDSANPSLVCWEYLYYSCPDRPNETGAPLNIGNPRTYTLNGNSHYYFNPAAYSMPAAGAGIGNSSRNPLHGPGLDNFDISLHKDIYITESTYFELRLETFNAFNHTQFKGPGNNSNGGVITDVSDPRFGRVVSALDPRVVQLGGKIYF